MSRACPLLGFVVAFERHPGATEAQWRAVQDDFVAMIERGGLACEERVATDHRRSYTVHGGAFQAADADRQALIEWARGRGEVARSEVGPLVDLDEAA